MKFLSFSGKWLELENIILSENNQAQKAKSHLFSLICGHSPKTNVAILWDEGHTKGRSLTGGIGQEKETKNLNVTDVFSVQE
jgi:hypothetical protein